MGHNVHTKTGIKSKLLEKAWQKGLVQTLSVSLGSQPGKLTGGIHISCVDNASVYLRATAKLTLVHDSWEKFPFQIRVSNADAHLIG